MPERRIRIIPNRREIDTARLAQALLDLVDQLSPEDKARYVAEGKKVLGELGGKTKPKGSAA